jgi:hypothetical protein
MRIRTGKKDKGVGPLDGRQPIKSRLINSKTSIYSKTRSDDPLLGKITIYRQDSHNPIPNTPLRNPISLKGIERWDGSK